MFILDRASVPQEGPNDTPDAFVYGRVEERARIGRSSGRWGMLERG